MNDKDQMFDEEEFLLELFQDGTMLTTLDNPYNPKEEFDKWLAFDQENFYFTSELIDRFGNFSPNDDERAIALKRAKAILLLLENDKEEIYKLV